MRLRIAFPFCQPRLGLWDIERSGGATSNSGARTGRTPNASHVRQAEMEGEALRAHAR